MATPSRAPESPTFYGPAQGDVSLGLRQTLHTQARRLELLARTRLEQIQGDK